MLKRTLSRFHVYVLWALASVFLWSFVFTRITDAPPEKKLSLYISAPSVQDTELAAQLEGDDLPPGIRMVKVHPFSYAMFDSEDLLSADLFLVKASEASGYQDSFAPLPPRFTPDLTLENGAQGILVYDAQTHQGLWDALIVYQAPGAQEENCYLFFGAESLHAGKLDTAAIWLAQRFLEGSQ